jgi:hypothetical protein
MPYGTTLSMSTFQQENISENADAYPTARSVSLVRSPKVLRCCGRPETGHAQSVKTHDRADSFSDVGSLI